MKRYSSIVLVLSGCALFCAGMLVAGPLQSFIQVGAIVAAACGPNSTVSTFAGLITGQNGRIEFTTDSVMLARDTGSSLGYWGPLVPLTPPVTVNGATSTLNGAILAGATSLTLSSAMSPQPALPFVILIGSEQLKATAVTGGGLNYTVVPGYDGTSQANHANGATVQVLNWTWFNQGTSTVSDTHGSLYIASNAVSGTHNAVGLKRPVVAPYSVVSSVGAAAASSGSWEALFGIVFRESSTGKMTTCQWDTNNSTRDWFSSATFWNNPTTPVSGPALENYRMVAAGGLPMIRAGDDGTNRTCDVSFNGGVSWINFYTETDTTNMVADEIGFFIDNYENSHTSAYAGFLASWSGY